MALADGRRGQTLVEEEKGVEEKGEGMGGEEKEVEDEEKEVGMTEDEDWEIGTFDPFGGPLLYPRYPTQKPVNRSKGNR